MGRLLILQTGNFGEACRRFDAGGEETYHEQRRSVDFVRDKASDVEITVASVSDEPYDEMVAPGLRAIGVRSEVFHTRKFGRDLIDECEPDRFLPRVPHAFSIQCAGKRGIQTFPCLADVFRSSRSSDLRSANGLRHLRSNIRARRVLSAKSVVGVGNHSLSAAMSVVRVLGVPKEKVAPWEWPRIAVRTHARTWPSSRPMELAYVGAAIETKGLGDLLDAFILLTRKSPGNFRLSVAGVGADLEKFMLNVRTAGAQEHVRFLGPVPRVRIEKLFEEADVLVVPSRRDYAEGLPNSVVEGLAHRLPLVVSRHPSFSQRLEDGRTCLTFEPTDSTGLALAVERLYQDSSLYERLSENAPRAYHSLFVGRTWYDLVSDFIEDPENRTDWLSKSCLPARVDPTTLQQRLAT